VSNREIIGLVGKKRSGKDTFAERLVYTWGWERVAFADPLRQAALALDPIISHWNYGGEVRYNRLSQEVDENGWEVAKMIPEVRRTLQRYGVAIREIDPDFWIKAARRHILRIPGPVVVTDVRFLNEAETITREMGGRLVRIVRPGLEDDGDTHPSEVELEQIETDFQVLNDGTIEDLQGHADGLVETLDILADDELVRVIG